MNQVDFFKNFTRDASVGALAPTSRIGIQKTCSSIDFLKDVLLVEYGPGDGALTHHVLPQLTQNSRYIAVETNALFARELRKIHDPRLEVVQESAERIRTILFERGDIKADYIVSSIPCTFLSHGSRLAFVRNTKESLKEGGSFIVYHQYSPLMRRYLVENFGNVQTTFVPFNIFPMFIMRSVKED